MYHNILKAVETWVINWTTVTPIESNYFFPDSKYVKVLYIFHSEDFSSFKLYTKDMILKGKTPTPIEIYLPSVLDFSKLLISKKKRKIELEEKITLSDPSTTLKPLEKDENDMISFSTKSYTQWSIKDVYNFLKLNQISHESATLVKTAEIDGQVIKDLTLKELEELKVPLGARKKMIKLFQELKDD